MTKPQTNHVPQALSTWFVIHFFTDILFAIPLMIAPNWMLSLVGWQTIDPFTARIAAAALFGIGIESYLARNASAESIRSLLNLKIIWSLSVVAGISLSLLEGAQGRPFFAWVTLFIFTSFNLIWIFWRRRLN
jgi:hypothetical protein